MRGILNWCNHVRWFAERVIVASPMSTEEHLTHEDIVPPLPGRALHLRLLPAAHLTWVGAGWAAICGMVATGALHLSLQTVAQALLTLVLADAVLGAVWINLLGLRNLSPARPRGLEHQAVTSVADVHVSEGVGLPDTPSPATNVALDDPPAANDLELEPAQTAFWASLGAGLEERLGHRPGDSSPGRFGLSRQEWSILARPLPSLDGLRELLKSMQAWWSQVITTYRQQVLEVSLLSGLALVLGLALGQGVAAFVALGLLLPLVVWFAVGGYPLRDSWIRAVVEIGVSWTLGLAAFSELPALDVKGLAGFTLSVIAWAGDHGTALAVGVLFVVAYYGNLTLDQSLRGIARPALVILPQVVGVVLLIAWYRPVLAGAAAILVLAQLLYQPYLDRQHVRWYLRTTQWMFMGVMLTVALGLAVSHF